MKMPYPSVDDKNITKGWLYSLGVMFLCLVFMYILIPTISTHVLSALTSSSATQGLPPAQVADLIGKMQFVVFSMRMIIWLTFFTACIYLFAIIFWKTPTGEYYG